MIIIIITQKRRMIMLIIIYQKGKRRWKREKRNVCTYAYIHTDTHTHCVLKKKEKINK